MVVIGPPAQPPHSTLLRGLTKDLPKDPLQAIVLFAERVELTLINPQRGNAVDHKAISIFIERFSRKFALDIKFPARERTESDFELMSRYIKVITSLGVIAVDDSVSLEIDQAIANYEGVSDVSFGLARLNAEEKEKIHNNITRIRKIIEESELSDRKKNALFERLAELAREVDAHGTRTDRFFAFAGDVAFVLGDMTQKAKPLLEEVRSMIKSISRSRARQEGIALPPGDEPLKLPDPSANKE